MVLRRAAASREEAAAGEGSGTNRHERFCRFQTLSPVSKSHQRKKNEDTMSNISQSGLRARSINLPVSTMLAGIGAVLALSAPSVALAQGKLCPVTFSVTSTETLGALQITTTYAAASALGDITGCTVAPTGADDVLVDPIGNDAIIGYADTTGFTGPALFATCQFLVTNDADPDPLAANFLVTIDDASDTGVPPGAENPTIGVAVGACVPAGSCSATPATGCKLPFAAGKSQLKFKDNADNTKDQGQFQWKSGSATLLSEFGTPLDAGETYSWCVYNAGALVRGSDVPAAGDCDGKPCWKAAGTTGFQFKGDVEGIAQIKLKEGVDGKAQVQVKAKSKAGNFASPTLPLSTNVVSQLVIDNGMTTTCFQATFTTPSKNDIASYGSKSLD